MKKNNLNIIFKIILVVSICGFGYFGYQLYKAGSEYKKGSDIYSDIRKIASEQKTPEPKNTETPTDAIMMGMSESKGDNVAAYIETKITATNFSTLSVAETPTKTLAPTQTPTPEPKKSQIDFDALKSVNEDVKGWIRLDGTKVDYPILQSDDNDFYLHHAITGEWNKVGTPYIDFRCKGDFSERITVVYGHYMENGTMFTDIHKYKGQKFFEEHPEIDLFTPDGDYKLIPIAGVFQNVDNWDFTFDFETDEAFMHYMSNWKAVSTFKTDTEYTPEDRYVVLTLCTYDIDNGRFLLIGILKDAEN